MRCGSTRGRQNSSIGGCQHQEILSAGRPCSETCMDEATDIDIAYFMAMTDGMLQNKTTMWKGFVVPESEIATVRNVTLLCLVATRINSQPFGQWI